MATRSPGEIMRLWFEEVWNGRDSERIAAYLAPHGVIYAVDEAGADARGPEQFRQFHQRFLDAFSGIRFTMDEVIEAGPMAASRWSVRLTHSGGGLGVPPTGAEVTLTGMAMIRVEDGMVVEGWNEWDRLKLATACRMVAPTA
jgi:predicted ester cyclase